MKPAPPVTSNLRTANFSDDFPQSPPPMHGGNTERAKGGRLVEQAVRRPLRRRWIFMRRDRRDLYDGRNDTGGSRLLRDGDSKVVPARDSRVRPVENPAGSSRCKGP